MGDRSPIIRITVQCGQSFRRIPGFLGLEPNPRMGVLTMKGSAKATARFRKINRVGRLRPSSQVIAMACASLESKGSLAHPSARPL